MLDVTSFSSSFSSSPAVLLALDTTTAWLMAGGGLVAGGVIAWLLHGVIGSRSLSAARLEAEGIRKAAVAEGETARSKIELEAEKKAQARREAFESEMNKQRKELRSEQGRLSKQLDSLDQRLESIAERERRLDQREESLRKANDAVAARQAEIEALHTQIRTRLENISGLSAEKARELVLEDARDEAEHESTRLTQQILETAEAEARSRSREITLMAIQRFAAEHVADSTVRSIKVPSDEMKGRIIGREGRNIRALERATGVDILVDDTPGVIAVSCFDPIRRAIASESLQKLVADGRVHPARIEEVVEKVRSEMQERIAQYGNEAVVEADVRGLHPKIIEAMGKMHFRTSYGQNVLRHSIEVAFLSQIIADQLGLDPRMARRCGFLHDIGKAMDHEMEGGHPAIGMEFCRKYGEKAGEVLNAIGGHHGDIPSSSPYTPIVMAADAISGARPGARRESMEMYIKRLEQLEGIAREHPFVDEVHAIQAGREVRVIVDAKRASDDDAFRIARDIAKRVEEEMTFPGEIKVTVLREVRAEATAR
ncbi:MAG: ribonuclease Y [Phycisphaerales bacterium]